MEDNQTYMTTRRFSLWFSLFKQWLTARFDAILSAFGDIDFSTLAKQGSNANVSLTTMDAKLGAYVVADSTEYGAFKSHMQTEIANILTPITEEE